MEKLHTTGKIKKALMMAGATLALGGVMFTADTTQAEASTWDERPLDAIQLDIQEVKESKSIEYQIQWGDTLGNIAKALGFEVTTLANANGIENIDVIIAGQYLVISEDAQGHTQVEVNEESSQPKEEVKTETSKPKEEVKEQAQPKEQPKEEAKPEVKAPAPVEQKAQPVAETNNERAVFNKVVAQKGVSQSDAEKWAFIIEKESSFNAQATNPSSGAYGLAQSLPREKMATHGNIHDPEVQLNWMFDYMVNRYGSISGAYNFWLNNKWY